MEIRDSVGDPKQGAANRTDDVKTVQGELNMHLVEDHRSDRWLEVKGRINSETLKAIDEFRRRHGLGRNGLIEPRDKTAHALSRYSGPRSMRVSHNLIQFLERPHEKGFCPTPCNDAADPHNATIGIGHKLHAGPVTQADRERWGTISRGEAEQILLRDLGTSEGEVNTDVRVPLNQNQFDALVSLTFNIGIEAFRGSTLVRHLNHGDYEGAAEHFIDWRRAGHAHPRGLRTRREWEEALFRQR
jgi:GH24 family phage-related lysozyme (muramidase)